MSITIEDIDGTLEEQEPIFGLATDCETLFANRINTLHDKDELDGAKLLSELYQRFAAWASFLGVFAESNVCLDRRLRHHVDIQDNVFALLDIMYTNLTCLFEREGASVQMDVDSVDSPHPLYISLSALDAISGAVDRLNQLALVIRRSSVTSETVKARRFAERFDLASFEALADGSLRALYPDASEGLREHLSRSMTETYALHLRRKSRQQHLQAPRSGRQASPLCPIKEEVHGVEAGAPMELDSRIPQPGEDVSAEAFRVRQSVTARLGPLTEPTSIDSQEVRAKMRKLLNPSRRSGTKSILAHQADYPLPAEGIMTCPWCFGPLPTGQITKIQWREHVNQDHLPYVCLSQDCSETLPRFAASAEWFQHMLSNHGEKWHQQVHAPWSWACPLCTTRDAVFTESSELSAHLDSRHRGDLTESQTRAIVGQSQFQFSRPRHICPICCFSVGDEQDDTGRAHNNGQTVSDSGDQRAAETHLESNVHPGTAANKPASVEAIATHVAAHLQFLMLLTLRLISIDDVAGASYDDQSLSSNPNDRSSDVCSDGRDRRLDVDTRSNSMESQQNSLESDFQRPSETHNTLEDSEAIDWAYILDPHALHERPSEGPGIDMDVSDPSGLDSTTHVSNVAHSGLSSVHSVLDLLLAASHAPWPMVQLAEQDIKNLCTEARKIFISQPMLLELVAPVKVVGDIDGQYADLLRVFETHGHPPETKYIFLGNYVGYGARSIEVLCLVLAYKVLYPESVMLLRGNHDSLPQTRDSELFEQCKRRYTTTLWATFYELFECMPVAAIIDEKIFCVHGGLSRDLQSMTQIQRILRPIDASHPFQVFSAPRLHTT
ncbi:hypothetical protein BJY00DRAFT_274103 [Aspergillus carlsbadensis]|nr:hypothetical protein BJY00DRAFT_274103 [Aspergillus carlsbadensis]